MYVKCYLARINMRGVKGVSGGKWEVLRTVHGHTKVEITYHSDEDSMFTSHGNLRSKHSQFTDFNSVFSQITKIQNT